MKAIRIHEPTGINGLVYEEVPDATPGLGDVLVKVAACGITHNELDWPVWTCRAGHQRSSIIPGQAPLKRRLAGCPHALSRIGRRRPPRCYPARLPAAVQGGGADLVGGRDAGPLDQRQDGADDAGEQERARLQQDACSGRQELPLAAKRPTLAGQTHDVSPDAAAPVLEDFQTS